jgi:glycosyltransferase involved in cell wall biosynthesis
MHTVSVIIPCYNQGAFVEEAIDSVLAQSYRDFEIIVIDDGSYDADTIAVLNGLQKPHTAIYHTPNAGVSAARNYGIAKSSGAFILPLDADDWIDSRLLSLVVPMLEQNASLELIGTGVQYFGEINAKELLPAYTPQQHLLQNLFFNTSLFRRTSFEKIKGYDESFKEGWEDWDLFLRLVQEGSQVHVINESLLHYRIKSYSRNADLQQEKKQRVEQQLFLKHIEKYRKFFPEPIQVLRDNQFLHEQVANFEKYKEELIHSKSYRLGHFILSPIKLLSKFGKSSK